MNKIQYDQTGGFPLTTNRLTNMQDAFAPLINGLGAMAGNLAIISGCNESGSIISDGVVQIGNEIFEFKQGIKQTYVTVFEEKIAAEFENGQAKAIVIKRYITFGAGTQNYKWADFKRIPPLNELLDFMKETREEITLLKAQNAPLSQGDGIVFFDNTADKVPPGYNEVPESEWRGRTVRNIDRTDIYMDEVGKYGGEKTHKITISELPKHSFRALTGDSIATAAKGSTARGVLGNEKLNTNVIGNDEPMSILDPYRIVLYIKWVGLGNGLNG